MKCSNCGKTEFENMQLYQIDCTEGAAKQLVKAYVCVNCGKVELFMPQEFIDKKIEQNRIINERIQAEENRKHEEERLRQRMQELEQFLQDENHTLKELREAQRELTEIQNKLNIRIQHTYFKL